MEDRRGLLSAAVRHLRDTVREMQDRVNELDALYECGVLVDGTTGREALTASVADVQAAVRV